jgi:SNF2 family DNA or RNA helicase
MWVLRTDTFSARNLYEALKKDLLFVVVNTHLLSNVKSRKYNITPSYRPDPLMGSKDKKWLLTIAGVGVDA